MTREDDEAFREQLSLATEFMTANYSYNDIELVHYLEKYDSVEQLQNLAVGLQALLGYTLKWVSELDGTNTKKFEQDVLRKLSEVILSFHRHEIGRHER